MKATATIIVRLALLVCLGAVWGCGPPSASQIPSTFPPTLNLPSQSSRGPTAVPSPMPAGTVDCGLFSGQGESAEAIATVGLAERVDPAHAPYPSNESERLIFRQIYETLIRADCQGNAVPGLADLWRLDTNRNAWTVVLRPNARFSDNTPVTSSAVVSSWKGVGVGAGNESEFRPEVRRLVRSIEAIDDRTLEIVLHSRRADAVLALAHTDLVIATPVPGSPAGSPWPLGTRAVRIDLTPSAITLTRLSGNSSTRFLVFPGRDGRDLLDQGVDLLLTRDTQTMEYAAALPQFQTSPLPWQRTHVLLMPGRDRTAASFSAEERRTLAQDAVRGPARGAEGPFWWESLSDCDAAASPLTPAQAPTQPPRIVYDSADSAARELAERLVAIGKYPRASGLTAEALTQALRRGSESGYIVSLDRRPLDACREMQILVAKAGWVVPQAIVPLVDTRLQAIVRRGRSGLNVEWDGGLILGGNGNGK